MGGDRAGEVAGSFAVAAGAVGMARIGRPTTLYAACITFAACYFLWIVWSGFASGFASDDPMNLFDYWKMGTAGIIRGNLLFFATANRPMGGLFYLPIYRFFHLNPLPYHIAISMVLAVNTFLLYRFACLLGVARAAAGFAAVLICSHTALSALYLSPSTVYDALCFLFYFGALVYYVRIRSAGEKLNWRQTLICLLLYGGALNSKEIGVTLPLLLLGYEELYQRPARQVRTPLIACGMALAYTIGKFAVSDSRTGLSVYRPLFTYGQYISNSDHFLDEIFYLADTWFTPARAALLIPLLGICAWLRKSKAVWFCLLLVLVSPLPIVFIPRRGQYNLYLPLTGWAMLAGIALWDVIRAVSPERVMSRRVVVAIRLALATLLLFMWSWNRAWREAFQVEAAGNQQRPTRDAIRQLRAFDVAIRPNSRVLFLNGPFVDLELYFLASLWYNDHSLQIFIQPIQHLTPAGMANMDYVFDWKNGHFVVVRAGKILQGV